MSAHIEKVGTVRGFDGMAFPANTGCQIFFEAPPQEEVVLFTNVHAIQTLFEVAFQTATQVTTVYEEKDGRNVVLQVRFNR